MMTQKRTRNAQMSANIMQCLHLSVSFSTWGPTSLRARCPGPVMASRIEKLVPKCYHCWTLPGVQGCSLLSLEVYALLSKLSTLLFKPTPDPKVRLQTVSLMRQCYVSLMQASLACYHAFQALFQAIQRHSQYTRYFFIRIPQIGPASVFLIFGQIKLKIILNFLQNLSLLFLISFVFTSFFFAKISYSFTKLIWYS